MNITSSFCVLTILHDLCRRLGINCLPGDRVYLAPGDIIPADLRIESVNELKIDESILTGEPDAVVKTVTRLDEQTALADRTNMAYSGTQVQSGTGKGIVVAIGSGD